MSTITIAGQAEPTGAWLHRFRNFGENLYVRLRHEWTIDIKEIDAAFDTFYIRDVPAPGLAEVDSILAGAIRTHHLEDSVFVLQGDSDYATATVVVIVDAAFGDQLFEIAARHDIWIVPSDANRTAAEELRKYRKEDGRSESVTIWSTMIPASTTEDWVAILDLIDLHHGIYSADPPVDALSVYGAGATAGITAALGQYDYGIVKSTTLGFIAFKTPRARQ